MPSAIIDQDRISEIINLKNLIRRNLKMLRSLSEETLSMLQKGCEVEPGPSLVEVDCVARGGEIVTRLLIDGRPIEDFFD